MNEQKIREYLEDVAQKERDHLRSDLTNPMANFQTRQRAWEVMEDLTVLLRGFMFCIEVSVSKEKADYFRQYFDQARSKNGLDGRKRG